MDNSKKFLKQKNIVPNISFKDGLAHTVVLLGDELTTIKDGTGKMIDGVSYRVTEKQELKRFFTTSISLIQMLSEVKIGTEVTIQMKNKKSPSGGFQSYFVVAVVGEEDNEIPVIEDSY